MLGDAERAQPGHVHVVQEHAVLAVGHCRVQFHPAGQRAESLQGGPEGPGVRVVVHRHLHDQPVREQGDRRAEVSLRPRVVVGPYH
jgi:hypothetical protein